MGIPNANSCTNVKSDLKEVFSLVKLGSQTSFIPLLTLTNPRISFYVFFLQCIRPLFSVTQEMIAPLLHEPHVYLSDVATKPLVDSGKEKKEAGMVYLWFRNISS